MTPSRPPLVILLLVAFACGPASAHDPRVQLDRKDDRIVVTVDGGPFTEYLFRTDRTPVLFPIHGPHGIACTRSFPLGPRVSGESTDHPHHASFWFAHGDVNGIDFWQGPGRVRHVSLDHVGDGRIETTNRWVGPGDRIVCTDRRVLAFSTDGDDRIIDHAIVLTASHGPLVFGDTKEGTMAVRVRDGLRVSEGSGHYRNAAGDRDDAVWGKPAAWVDLSGTLDGRPMGIACFDHPDNVGFPNAWHARAYGLFAANPFFNKPAGRSGRVALNEGQSLTLRHRWLFHAGDCEAARIADRHAAWARGSK
jgi:hypothetical protein